MEGGNDKDDDVERSRMMYERGRRVAQFRGYKSAREGQCARGRSLLSVALSKRGSSKMTGLRLDMSQR